MMEYPYPQDVVICLGIGLVVYLVYKVFEWLKHHEAEKQKEQDEAV